MKIRLIDWDKDLDTIQQWWKNSGVDELDIGMLSDVGLMAYEGDKDICAAWLFETNSDMCMIGWFVSGRNNKKQIDRGLKLLIEKGEAICRDAGFRLITTYSQNKSMIKRLKNLNYIYGDKDIIQLIKGL